MLLKSHCERLIGPGLNRALLVSCTARMSLPKFDTKGSLFESLGSLAGNLFSDQDRYKLFATKIWPLLAKSREELAACYVLDNGRPGVEPVILLGVLIFQFLERVPDRQAAELVKYP